MPDDDFNPADFDPLRPLLNKTAGGDRQAFGDLYDALAPRAFGLACKITGDRRRAERAMLEAFTRVWRNAARHQSSRGNVTAWVLMIVRDEALAAEGAAAESSASTQASAPAPAPVPTPLPLGDADLALNAEQQWRARRVRRALATLPGDERRAVEQAFLGGRNPADVAGLLGEPPHAVENRLRSGVRTLKRLLLEGPGGTGGPRGPGGPGGSGGPEDTP